MGGAGPMDGRWQTGREIEAALPPPSEVDDPENVFGEGVVVDCLSRVGVLAMPADLPIGLNLTFTGSSHFRLRVDGSEDTWEFAPHAATLLRTYLDAHPALVAAVVRSAHKADRTKNGAVGESQPRFACGKFIRGVSPMAAAEARQWREKNLPANLLAMDKAHEPNGKSSFAAAATGGQGGNSRTRRLERRRDPSSGSGDAVSSVAEARPPTKEPKAKLEPKPKPALILVPASAPAVPAWGVPRVHTKGGTEPKGAQNMADILAEESSNAHRHENENAAPRAVRTRDGVVSRDPVSLSQNAKSSSGGGSFADLLRSGSSGASRDSSGGWVTKWAVRDGFRTGTGFESSPGSVQTQTPSAPQLPKMTPESLSKEARRSKIDQFGKIKCLVCGRMYKSYGPLEQHLAASHFGLNSAEAKAIEAALLASGAAVPGDGSGRTNEKKRPSLQLGQILEQPRGRLADGAASLAASLSAYIREAKPTKAAKRIAAANAGGPKGKGKMVVNPNRAMSSGMVMRRGKEREGPKKKKRPTKLKRIILTARAVRAETEEDAKHKADEEVEVTVEVGRVYVNLLFDKIGLHEASDGRVLVDLIYLEEEDADVDGVGVGDGDGDEWEVLESEEAQEAEAIDAREIDETQDETEEAKEEISVPETSPPKPDPPLTAVTPVTLPTNPWAMAGGFKGALLRAETLAAEEAAAAAAASGESEAAAKPKKKKKQKKRDPTDGSGEKRKPGVARTCDVCDVTCSGDDAWFDHLKGKAHAKAERRVERDTGEGIGETGVGGAKPHNQNAPTFIGTDVSIRYADQVITPELNAVTTACVSELKRFQDRAYFKDQVKARMRRRLVFGLREVAKAVQLKKARAVVVAPNIEETNDAEGGLDDVVAKITAAARENGTPIVFALTRNKLGRIVGKRMRISALAILDQDGAVEQFREMLACAAAGRDAFRDEAEKKKDEAEKKAADAERASAKAEEAEFSGKDGENLGVQDTRRREESNPGAEPTLNPAAATFVPRNATAS